MLGVFVAVAILVTAAYSADHEVLKDCSRIPFCASLRHQILEESSQYSAQVDSLKHVEKVAVIPLKNSKNEYLNLEIHLLVGNKIRVKVLEQDHSRYELADVLVEEPAIVDFLSNSEVSGQVTLKPLDGDYSVIVKSGPPFLVEFYYKDQLEVVLNGDRLAIENTKTSQAFSFNVEFEGASTLYGLNDHTYKLQLGETADDSVDPFRIKNTENVLYEIDSTMSLYGSIPVVYGHSANWTSGIFFHNAAEEWIDIDYNNKPSAYIMAESGTLDIFVLLGPTPKEVVRQYTNLTGTAHLPQLWALGYHQCRWTYHTQEEVKEVVAQMDAHDFPLDVIWLDDGHTNGYRYFEWNTENFTDPVEMLNNISSTNRKAVSISDPHIKTDVNYPVYAEAKDKYLIKWPNGSDYVGTCWPGAAGWIDFLNPEASDFYGSWYAFDKFNGTTPTLAGIWNDMNEPASFEDEYERTISFDTIQNGNVLHRDVHNIYGMLHTRATHKGLMLRDEGKKRPFILSRSHFAGSQRYAATWTGDNAAYWPHLAVSFSQCLNSNILGLVFCGADVAGFYNETEPELYQRWYQAAAWIPFFRGHSHKNVTRREPYLFNEEIQKVVREAIRQRYRHLPVWYTLFYEHARYGDPLIRPLFYHYPEYLGYDDHLLLGSDILVRGVMEPEVKYVSVTFPGNELTYWYSVNSALKIYTGGSTKNVEVDISAIPVFYRGGSIIARKNKDRGSTTDMLDDPYTLYISVDSNKAAEGRLYIDDFTSFEYVNDQKYLYVQIYYRPENKTIEFQSIDGNFKDFELYIQSVVYRQNSADGVQESIYETTSDGTVLETINIAKELADQDGEEFVLYLPSA